ncbi:M23 family metallopeptidase [Streptomyces sp. NPDC005408]|uniref:M23 family metallopeptidase n=1 Tax=Streptomyces sp. NPDC005408 TaxID=3155341 RepID=UPI0033A049D3
MNDQHAHAGYVGYDGYSTGSFDTDPLFGALPGSYEAGHSGQYDTTQWDTGSHQTGGYDVYGAQQAQQPQYTQQFPQYDATGAAGGAGQYDTSAVQYDTTGQWDAGAWNQTTQTGQYETAAATFAYDTTGQWAAPAFDTGTYDATAWNTGAEALVPHQFTPQHEFLQTEFHGDVTYDGITSEFQPDFQAEFQPDLTTEFQPEFEATEFEAAQFTAEPEPEAHFEAEAEIESEADDEPGAASEFDSEFTSEPEPLSAAVTPRPVRRSGGSRGRRRTPAKRSALLTVAVPSACVMGVAGIAAASVGNLGTGDTKDGSKNVAAADPSSVKPVAANNKMDTQLAALSADARDFGDRASRTQERLDLKARQEAEKQKREEEAKRREAMRPKFVLPVKQQGLSAYYGQAGVNWMSVHTGIDFPVSYGTEVMAATDGTVRTQWNSAYGNMAIVTSPDGTETWYCHLSSTKIRSGSIKAGDVIAYSGNSGNSTGPHLHFEVRPGGGSAIDPLPWLRSHGLDPT